MSRDDRETFERDLEKAMGFLDRPPRPGSAEDRRFCELLARLDRRQATEPAPPTAAPDENGVSDLDRRLEALSRRRRGEPRPDGLGPTLGMDLRRS